MTTELVAELERRAARFAAVATVQQAISATISLNEAYREIYRRRIQRWKSFSIKQFGAFGAELTAISGFFDHGLECLLALLFGDAFSVLVGETDQSRR